MKVLEKEEIAFCGKITAGVTHEINNVLAIIKESSGLIEDLLSLSEESSFPYQDKLFKSLSTIDEQVKRGVELTKKFNQFAHSSDEIIAHADLNILIEQIIFLSLRFARKNSITLVFNPSDQPVTILTNPFLLQIVLFELMEYCWDNMFAEGRINCHLQKEEKGAIIKIIYDEDLKDRVSSVQNILLSEKWIKFEKMLTEIKGSIVYEKSRFSFILTLPDKINNL